MQNPESLYDPSAHLPAEQYTQLAALHLRTARALVTVTVQRLLPRPY